MVAMAPSNTSPAKILPNNLNDSEATLAISPIISIIPTKALIGLTIIIEGSFLNFLGISKNKVASFLNEFCGGKTLRIKKIDD